MEKNKKDPGSGNGNCGTASQSSTQHSHNTNMIRLYKSLRTLLEVLNTWKKNYISLHALVYEQDFLNTTIFNLVHEVIPLSKNVDGLFPKALEESNKMLGPLQGVDDACVEAIDRVNQASQRLREDLFGLHECIIEVISEYRGIVDIICDR